MKPDLSAALPGWRAGACAHDVHVIGVLLGEGVGPEVMGATLDVLRRIEALSPYRFEVREGGEIGLPAEARTGRALTHDVVAFCRSIFADGGVVLCGPGGGRFVYDLRSRFDLFCKLTPIRPSPSLDDTGAVRGAARAGVDMVIVRENAGGLYFGQWGHSRDGDRETAFQHFSYRDDQVARILDVAVGLAERRDQALALVLKTHGVPAISALWKRKLLDSERARALNVRILEVDNAVYQLVAQGRDFDVLVAPNMFGDVLSDAAALLLGSRGVSFSGNFGAPGIAVYQTGHGAAHDLAGTDRANPVGQILSLAMLLRESFGLNNPALAIERAVVHALGDGWRTADIATPGCRVVGTRELGMRIADGLAEHRNLLAA